MVHLLGTHHDLLEPEHSCTITRFLLMMIPSGRAICSLDVLGVLIVTIYASYDLLPCNNASIGQQALLAQKEYSQIYRNSVLLVRSSNSCR
jgi:hypothetical protein